MRPPASLLLALALSCCTASRASAPAASAPTATTVQVVFAGSMSGETCQRRERKGCDIYAASLDLATGALSGVQPVATTRDKAEDFPILEPGGDRVFYTRLDGRTPNIMVVRPGGKPRVLVSGGGAASISSDGSLLAYQALVGGKEDAVVRPLDLSEDPPGLGKVRAVSDNALEPFVVPGSRQVAYYKRGSQPRTGKMYLRDLDSGADTLLIDADACAHGGASPSGQAVLCQSEARARIVRRTDTGWSAPTVVRYADPGDPDFAGCTSLTYEHPRFCGDDDHLLVTYSCRTGGDITASRIMVQTLGGEVVSLVSKQAAAALGKDPGDARSGSCAVAR